MKRRLAVLILMFAGVAGVLYYTDFGTFWSAVSAMPRATLLTLLALLALNSLVKAARWAFYLRSGELDIPWRAAFTSYLAGMAASPLPGGSLLAPRLAQEHGSVKMRQATPALFVTAVADALAVAGLALLLSLIHEPQHGRLTLPMAGLLFALVLITVGRSARLWSLVGRLLARLRFTRNWLPQEADIQRRVATMLRTSVVAGGVLLSVMTTLISIATLVVLVNGLTLRGIRPGEAADIHTTAEMVGIILPISLGISFEDSSLAGMLNTIGIGWIRVVYVVLALRSLTMLGRTTLGSVVLVACYHPLLRSALALRRRARAARHFAWRNGSRFRHIATYRRTGTPN